MKIYLSHLVDNFHTPASHVANTFFMHHLHSLKLHCSSPIEHTVDGSSPAHTVDGSPLAHTVDGFGNDKIMIMLLMTIKLWSCN